ncbi:MAG: PAS domain-containing protein, partial [Campylobacteraceae bacterium]|nr:PAS domain-containing protein [Campylobacteraceae bacterium]
MKLKQLFLLLFIVNISFLSLLVFIISDYHEAIKKMEDAYKMQHKSLILANELRQSSDDLTRVARTYVITGNKMYEEQFHTILDIRNGIIPRPLNYNSIYWDFLTLNGSKPSLRGETIALRNLMKQAGFQDIELALLYKSQKESDDLTYLEIKAMNAIKGIFQDSFGFYTKKAKPDFELARDIMHAQKYHKAKIAIMKPLDEFYTAFKHRTNTKVEETKNEVKLLERYVSFSILFLIILVLFSSFIILSRIIYPLETLKNAMLRLAKNDMEVQIPIHENNDEVSEMIGTVEIFKKNAIELIHSEQKNKSILDLAGDGIFGLDEKGKFTFLNPMACKLLGFDIQDEIIGQYLY